MDDEVLEKIKKYCAYQERCHQDVRYKLLKMKIYGDDLEEIIVQLIQENYLNEERYAQSYVRGKFRFNHWGKIKIQQGLRQKNISDYCIRQGMAQIDTEEYQATLRRLIQKRRSLRPQETTRQTANFLLQKGYESALIWELMGQQDTSPAPEKEDSSAHLE